MGIYTDANKEYIGIKKVNAIPMTRGDYNRYKGWTISENENPDDDGYLVIYSDDYESWSPRKQFDEAYHEVGVNPLNDTTLLMVNNDYKDRLKAEYIQLKIRCKGLERMIEKYKYGNLPFCPKCPLEMFETQLYNMKSYKYILEKRAEIEGIDLD